MKFHLGIFCAVLFAFAASSAAQGPDTTYVRIYHVIQQADALAEKGENQKAMQMYREAQDALLTFQETHTKWNPNVIRYRINYVANKLGPLEQSLQPAETPPDPPPAIPASPEEMTARLGSLQNEIQRLKTENRQLEEKLQEAWSAQPAAAPPEELAQAQQRIQSLQRERDLLQVALNRQDSPQSPDEISRTLEQERRILAEVRRQLQTQSARADRLESENAQLKEEVASLKSGTTTIPDSDVARQLSSTAASLEDMRATNVALRTQIILLETQVADLIEAASRPGSDQAAALADELKSVKSELRSTTREKERLANELTTLQENLKQGNNKETLALEMASVQARLQVLEAEAVPFTPQELALIDHGADMQMALSTDDNLPERKPAELPPGAGPIMAQAERAIDLGQFDVAEERLRDILRQDEDNPITLTKLAAVMMEKENPEEAERFLKRSLAVDPMDPAANYVLGILKYQQAQYDEAFTALSLSSRINPDKPETQYFLGLTLLQKGNREPAETALRKAIQLRPNWGIAHYELALVYATQDPPYKELAEWHYQKAVGEGAPRNFELEKILEEAETTTPNP